MTTKEQPTVEHRFFHAGQQLSVEASGDEGHLVFRITDQVGQTVFRWEPDPANGWALIGPHILPAALTLAGLVSEGCLHLRPPTWET